MGILNDLRKQRIFRTVVREYLRSAEPVGSATVLTRCRLTVSPATVRNDMVELEELGLLEQPHTSAGRIPTEAGYRIYVEEFLAAEEAVVAEEQRQLEAAVARFEADAAVALRTLAKSLAAITDETVVLGFGPAASYVSGMTNLARKPEFREPELAVEISHTVDALDEMVIEVTRRSSPDVNVFIGAENPFGHRMSVVITTCEVPEFGEGVIGILGPTRMDYDANVARMRAVRQLLEEIHSR